MKQPISKHQRNDPVKINFRIPLTAAVKLREIAISNDQRLLDIGILKVQFNKESEIPIFKKRSPKDGQTFCKANQKPSRRKGSVSSRTKKHLKSDNGKSTRNDCFDPRIVNYQNSPSQAIYPTGINSRCWEPVSMYSTQIPPALPYSHLGIMKQPAYNRPMYSPHLPIKQNDGFGVRPNDHHLPSSEETSTASEGDNYLTTADHCDIVPDLLPSSVGEYIRYLPKSICYDMTTDNSTPSSISAENNRQYFLDSDVVEKIQSLTINEKLSSQCPILEETEVKELLTESINNEISEQSNCETSSSDLLLCAEKYVPGDEQFMSVKSDVIIDVIDNCSTITDEGTTSNTKTIPSKNTSLVTDYDTHAAASSRIEYDNDDDGTSLIPEQEIVNQSFIGDNTTKESNPSSQKEKELNVTSGDVLLLKSEEKTAPERSAQVELEMQPDNEDINVQFIDDNLLSCKFVDMSTAFKMITKQKKSKSKIASLKDNRRGRALKKSLCPETEQSAADLHRHCMRLRQRHHSNCDTDSDYCDSLTPSDGPGSPVDMQQLSAAKIKEHQSDIETAVDTSIVKRVSVVVKNVNYKTNSEINKNKQDDSNAVECFSNTIELTDNSFTLAPTDDKTLEEPSTVGTYTIDGELFTDDDTAISTNQMKDCSPKCYPELSGSSMHGDKATGCDKQKLPIQEIKQSNLENEPHEELANDSFHKDNINQCIDIMMTRGMKRKLSECDHEH